MKIVPVDHLALDGFKFDPRNIKSVTELLTALDRIGLSGEFFALMDGQVRLIIKDCGDSIDHLDPGWWLIIDGNGAHRSMTGTEFNDKYREAGS